jgi:hypothetical protein
METARQVSSNLFPEWNLWKWWKYPDYHRKTAILPWQRQLSRKKRKFLAEPRFGCWNRVTVGGCLQAEGSTPAPPFQLELCEQENLRRRGRTAPIISPGAI